jgi:cell division protein FtsI (penicillin-binding protein 3)
MAVKNQNTTQGEKDRISFILFWIYAFLLVFGLVVVGRIVYIQWFWELDPKIESYFRLRPTDRAIEPDRGAIIGCDGKLLAMSTPFYDLRMDCTVQKKAFAEKAADNPALDSLERNWLKGAKEFSIVLAEETGKDADEIYRSITDGRKKGARYLKLASNLDRGTILNLEEKTFMKLGKNKSGVIVERKETRQYPYGTLARRTIGYVKNNSNSNGNNHIGLEGKYDYALHGKEGRIWLSPSDAKENIQNFDSTYVKPEDGLDVRTTLDITLQSVADKAMRSQMSANPIIIEGCAVIMDVKTGAIRAMVNLTKSQKDSSLNEVYNMAIGYASAPGSVFKATTLMTVLEDGYIKSLDDVIPKNKGKVPGEKYKALPADDHIKGTDSVSILHGFEISSNYVFQYLAAHYYDDDPKRFLDKLYQYKLGQAFDFDLEGLAKPTIPSPESKQWSPIDLPEVAFGYTVQVTPLHMLTFYNAIANKGRMMKPYLVEDLEKDGVVKTKMGPSVLNASICSRATADTLLRAMKAVTSDGTAATRLKGAKLKIAGKTGTSNQNLTKEDIAKYGLGEANETKDGQHRQMGTFVGFFPADNPKYSAIICMKSGLTSEDLYGGGAPAAAMREIVDAIYVLDPEWGSEYQASAKVPEMTAGEEPAQRTDDKTATVPDVKGLGLKDAIYMVENSGLRCNYSGTGHVSAQSEAAGRKVAAGTTVTLTLK